MAEMTIRLETDPITGKKNITVALRSDEDALPQEHEQQHKALLDKLIEGGIVKAGEIGTIVVERETADEESASSPTSVSEEERRSVSEGN